MPGENLQLTGEGWFFKDIFIYSFYLLTGATNRLRPEIKCLSYMGFRLCIQKLLVKFK